MRIGFSQFNKDNKSENAFEYLKTNVKVKYNLKAKDAV